MSKLPIRNGDTVCLSGKDVRALKSADASISHVDFCDFPRAVRRNVPFASRTQPDTTTLVSVERRVMGSTFASKIRNMVGPFGNSFGRSNDASQWRSVICTHCPQSSPAPQEGFRTRKREKEPAFLPSSFPPARPSFVKFNAQSAHQGATHCSPTDSFRVGAENLCIPRGLFRIAPYALALHAAGSLHPANWISKLDPCRCIPLISLTDTPFPAHLNVVSRSRSLTEMNNSLFLTERPLIPDHGPAIHDRPLPAAASRVSGALLLSSTHDRKIAPGVSSCNSASR